MLSQEDQNWLGESYILTSSIHFEPYSLSMQEEEEEQHRTGSLHDSIDAPKLLEELQTTPHHQSQQHGSTGTELPHHLYGT